MAITKQELLDQIEQIEYDMKVARNNIIKAKKEMDDSESELIGLKLNQEKLTAQLTNLIDLTPRTEAYEYWELDLERFRKAYPELCEWARARDLAKVK